jgi:hypothetical protein
MPPLQDPSIPMLRTTKSSAIHILKIMSNLRMMMTDVDTWLRMEFHRTYWNSRIPYIPPKHGTIFISTTLRKKDMRR